MTAEKMRKGKRQIERKGKGCGERMWKLHKSLKL